MPGQDSKYRLQNIAVGLYYRVQPGAGGWLRNVPPGDILNQTSELHVITMYYTSIYDRQLGECSDH